MSPRPLHIRARTIRLIAAACAIGAVTTVAAQQALDRTKTPPPGKTPALHVPTWTRSTLANGAELVVSEKHDLPLVAFTLNFIGGATTREGEALSNAMQLLGTGISVGIGGESGTVTFQSTADKFGGALYLAADMLLHPTFPEAAI